MSEDANETPHTSTDGTDGTATGRADPETPINERVHALLLSVTDLAAFLELLAGLAAELVEGASCGITVRYDGHLLTVGSSDPRAELLDETQYRTSTGPCLEAMDSGKVVSCSDTLTEQRWPTYVVRARETGLRCSLSLPLVLGEESFGALNLYGFDRPAMFEEPMHRQAEVYAAQAAGTLRLASRQNKDAELMSQMEQSLRSRTTIDQAMGIIMAQQRCGPDQAFAILRAQSQNNRRRLRDVAADLVTRVSGEAPQVGRPFDAG